MASLVIYVVLFSGLTVLLSMIYNNMNDTLFFNRGRAINYTTLNKLQYNITESAYSSDNVQINQGIIIYSNGDEYVYNEEKDMIILNGGVLCTNVSDFNAEITEIDGYKQVKLTVTLNKYLNELEKEIISNVEVN